MAGKKTPKDENVRALTKVSGGASFAVTLPMKVIKAFRWKERQKLYVTVDMRRKTMTLSSIKRK